MINGKNLHFYFFLNSPHTNVHGEFIEFQFQKVNIFQVFNKYLNTTKFCFLFFQCLLTKVVLSNLLSFISQQNFHTLHRSNQSIFILFLLNSSKILHLKRKCCPPIVSEQIQHLILWKPTAKHTLTRSKDHHDSILGLSDCISVIVSLNIF